MRQVCGALDEAHVQGIIHRDLKPENIMLTDARGRNRLRQGARLRHRRAHRVRRRAKEQKLTQQGMVLGTPPYMSPEQFTGKALDARSDIYSLGVMAYEMLTGKLPFEADTPWQWATQHMTAQPTPFEVSAPAQNIPHGMRDAILKSLPKDREKRQASARDFFAELSGGGRMTVTGEGGAKPSALEHRSDGSGSRLRRRQPAVPVYAPALRRTAGTADTAFPRRRPASSLPFPRLRLPRAAARAVERASSSALAPSACSSSPPWPSSRRNPSSPTRISRSRIPSTRTDHWLDRPRAPHRRQRHRNAYPTDLYGDTRCDCDDAHRKTDRKAHDDATDASVRERLREQPPNRDDNGPAVLRWGSLRRMHRRREIRKRGSAKANFDHAPTPGRNKRCMRAVNRGAATRGDLGKNGECPQPRASSPRRSDGRDEQELDTALNDTSCK